MVEFGELLMRNGEWVAGEIITQVGSRMALEARAPDALRAARRALNTILSADSATSLLQRALAARRRRRDEFRLQTFLEAVHRQGIEFVEWEQHNRIVVAEVAGIKLSLKSAVHRGIAAMFDIETTELVARMQFFRQHENVARRTAIESEALRFACVAAARELTERKIIESCCEEERGRLRLQESEDFARTSLTNSITTFAIGELEKQATEEKLQAFATEVADVFAPLSLKWYSSLEDRERIHLLERWMSAIRHDLHREEQRLWLTELLEPCCRALLIWSEEPLQRRAVVSELESTRRHAVLEHEAADFAVLIGECAEHNRGWSVSHIDDFEAVQRARLVAEAATATAVMFSTGLGERYALAAVLSVALALQTTHEPCSRSIIVMLESVQRQAIAANLRLIQDANEREELEAREATERSSHVAALESQAFDSLRRRWAVDTETHNRREIAKNTRASLEAAEESQREAVTLEWLNSFLANFASRGGLKSRMLLMTEGDNRRRIWVDQLQRAAEDLVVVAEYLRRRWIAIQQAAARTTTFQFRVGVFDALVGQARRAVTDDWRRGVALMWECHETARRSMVMLREREGRIHLVDLASASAAALLLRWSARILADSIVVAQESHRRQMIAVERDREFVNLSVPFAATNIAPLIAARFAFLLRCTEQQEQLHRFHLFHRCQLRTWRNAFLASAVGTLNRVAFEEYIARMQMQNVLDLHNECYEGAIRLQHSSDTLRLQFHASFIALRSKIAERDAAHPAAVARCRRVSEMLAAAIRAETRLRAEIRRDQRDELASIRAMEEAFRSVCRRDFALESALALVVLRDESLLELAATLEDEEMDGRLIIEREFLAWRNKHLPAIAEFLRQRDVAQRTGGVLLTADVRRMERRVPQHRSGLPQLQSTAAPHRSTAVNRQSFAFNGRVESALDKTPRPSTTGSSTASSDVKSRQVQCRGQLPSIADKTGASMQRRSSEDIDPETHVQFILRRGPLLNALLALDEDIGETGASLDSASVPLIAAVSRAKQRAVAQGTAMTNDSFVITNESAGRLFLEDEELNAARTLRRHMLEELEGILRMEARHRRIVPEAALNSPAATSPAPLSNSRRVLRSTMNKR